MKVRQTSCRFCGQDIENFSPYRAGEWRDRGGNSTCPTIAGDKGLHHAPYREGRDRDLKICPTCNGPVDAPTVRAGGEVCFDCSTTN